MKTVMSPALVLKSGILDAVSGKQFRQDAAGGGGSAQGARHIAEPDGPGRGFTTHAIGGIHLNGAGGTFRRYGSIGLLDLNQTSRGAGKDRARGARPLEYCLRQ